MFRIAQVALTLALATAGLAYSGQAHAVDGLEWKWEEGQTRRFVSRVEMELPEPVMFNAEVNQDAFLSALNLAVVMACTPEANLKKRGWEIRCVLEDVAIAGRPIPNSVGRIQPIAQEWSDKLKNGGELLIIHGRDGTIRQVALEGVDKRLRRMQNIQEIMRQVLTRAVAPLDLQLPKKGDTRGSDSWQQRNALPMHYLSPVGTMGGMKVEHKISTQDGDTLVVHQSGSGTVGGAQMGANDQPRNLFAVNMTGTSTFDRAAGHFTDVQYLVRGLPTASGTRGEGGGDVEYRQATKFRLLDGDEKPTLFEPAEIGGAQQGGSNVLK